MEHPLLFLGFGEGFKQLCVLIPQMGKWLFSLLNI